MTRNCAHCNRPQDILGCTQSECTGYNREARSAATNLPYSRRVSWGSFQSDDSWFYDEVEQSKDPFEYIGK